MPHLTIEYSKNLEKKLDLKNILRDAHTSLIDCPGIDMSRVKSRLHSCEYVLNQNDARDVDMIHITLSILSGRDGASKKKYGEKLYASLKKNVPEQMPVALSVEIRDMDQDSYVRN